MSWETDEWAERAICACGQGYVERSAWSKSDDWNRVESGHGSSVLHCADCRNRYHIEDGVWLVPNGETIHNAFRESTPHLEKIDEEIVAKYDIPSIRNAISDMSENKFSTRVMLDSTKSIIDLYYKHNHSRKLVPIMNLLKDILVHYPNYKWTFDLYHRQLDLVIEDDKRVQYINNYVKSRSFHLDFHTFNEKRRILKMEKKKFQFPDGTIVECDVDDKNDAIHEINKHAPCACGKGIVIRKLEFYLKNGMPGIRYPSHEIKCEECNKKYNLTRLTLSEPTDELRTEPDGYVVHVPNFKFIDVLRPKDASGDVFTEEEFKKLYIINWEED